MTNMTINMDLWILLLYVQGLWHVNKCVLNISWIAGVGGIIEVKVS